MSESVRHRGTEPPNPHSPEPEQEHPLGQWNKLSDVEEAELQQHADALPEEPFPEEPFPPEPLPPQD